MQASVFVGRIGVLAVALGVGVAVSVGMPGAAYASPEDKSSPVDQSSPAESGGDAVGAPARSTVRQRAERPESAPTRGSSGAGARSKETVEIPTSDTDGVRGFPPEQFGGPTPQNSKEAASRPARAVPAPAPISPQREERAETDLPEAVAADDTALSSWGGDTEPTPPAALAPARSVAAPVLVAAPPVSESAPVMAPAPVRPAAAGSVQSWAPRVVVDSVLGSLLGIDPAAPVQSPVSWVMLAAARREIGVPAAATAAPAAAVTTGQTRAPAPSAATPVAAPAAAAATNSPPVISSVTLGAANASTGAVTGTVRASDPNGERLTYKATVASAIKGKVSITSAGVFTYTPTATARHAAARAGAATAVTTDTVTVTVTDAKGAAVTRAVSVPISPKNAAPTAGKATVGAPNATTGVVTGKVSATDADKDTLTFSAPAATAKGTVRINAGTGAFTYTPTAIARHAAARIGAATAAKTDSFTVTVTDGYGGRVAVPVSVSIRPTNTAPTATVSIAKPDPVSGVAKGKVSASDADKDTLSYAASKPASGTVVTAADGSFTYTPTAAARSSARSSSTAKTDTFTITVADGHGGSSAVKVTATIAPANAAPVAGTPSASTNATTGVVTGTVNASDPDKDTLTYTAATTTTAKGTASVTTAGAYTYTPTATARHAAARTGATTAVKTDTFTVTATDKFGAATAIPVSVTIAPANAKPVAGTPTVGAPNASTGVVTGTVSATDADKDTLSYSAPATTSKGAVAIIAGTGAFTYTPTATARHAAARIGAVAADKSDTFTVTATDGFGGSVAIPIAVTVAPANANPLAGTPTVGSPDASTGVVTGTVSATDADKDPLTYSGSATTAKGAVTVAANGSFTYTPTLTARQQATATTTDTFTAIVSDGYGGTARQTVTVPVDPGTPVVGGANVGTPNVNTGIVTGTAKFTDTAARNLTYSVQPNSTGGGAVGINTTNGAFTYTPTQAQRQAAGSRTTDTITVIANNGVRSATQTITVPVDPGNVIPGDLTTVAPDPATGVVKGRVAFIDTAARKLSYTVSTSGAPSDPYQLSVTTTGGGTVSISPTTGSFTYTPTRGQRQAVQGYANDSFAVTASNGVNKATAIISVEIDPGTPVADWPTVGVPNVNTGSLTGTVKFSDTAGRTLTYSGPATSSGGGAFSIDRTTGAFTYTPTREQRQAAGSNTGDSITVTASNGVRETAQTFYVLVDPGTPVTATPIAGSPDATTGVVNGTASFTDTAGRPLTYTTSTAINGGTVSINNTTGSFTYTPAQLARYKAWTAAGPKTDTFTITANNGVRSANQTVNVTISPLPAIPTAPAAKGTFEVVATTGSVTGAVAATDPAGFPLTYSANTSPANGTVTVNSDGTFTYVPALMARVKAGSGTGPTTDSFSVTASNGGYSGAAGNISVPITAPTQNSVIAIVEVTNVDSRSALSDLALSPDGSRLYVASNSNHTNAGTISIIDTATSRVARTIPLSTGATDIAPSPDSRLYALDLWGSLKVIDTATNTITSAITPASGAGRFEVNPDSSRLYTINGDGTVSVINTANNAVTQTIPIAPVGRRLSSLAISPDGRSVYVSDSIDTVTTIDTATNTVTNVIQIPLIDWAGLSDLAVSPDGNRVYVATYGKTLAVIDTVNNTVTTNIAGKSLGSAEIAVSPDGRRLYVVSGCAEAGNCANGKVSVIDTTTNTLTATIPLGASPTKLAISGDGHLLYVANSNRFPGVVSVIYT